MKKYLLGMAILILIFFASGVINAFCASSDDSVRQLLSKRKIYISPGGKKGIINEESKVTGQVISNKLSKNKTSPLVNITITSPLDQELLNPKNQIIIYGNSVNAITKIEWGQGDNPTAWSTSGTVIGGGQGELGSIQPFSFPQGQSGLYTLRLSDTLNSQSKVTIYAEWSLKQGWPVGIDDGDFFDSAWTTVKDLNNDGKIELVNLSGDRKLRIFNSDGAILCQADLSYGGQVTHPVITDIDSDGKDEIIIMTGADGYNLTRLYLYDTNGNLRSGWPVAVDEIDISGGCVVADIDKDPFNTKEIIISGFGIYQNVWGWYLTVYDCNGNRISGWPKKVNPGTVNGFASAIFSGSLIPLPVVGNLDNDPELEIVTTAIEMTDIFNDRNNTTTIYLDCFDYNGSSIWGGPKVVSQISGDFSSCNCFASPVLGNLVGDEKDEIVVGTIDGVYAYDAGGNLLSGWPNLVGNKNFISSLALSDLDLDGKAEVIVSVFPDGVNNNYLDTHIYKGDGSQYLTRDRVRTWLTTGNVSGDVDKDGLLDVISTTNPLINLVGQLKLSIWHSNDPRSAFYEKNYSKLSPYAAPIFCDLDNDGINEVILTAYYYNSGPRYLYIFELDDFPCGSYYSDWPMLQHDETYSGRYNRGSLNNLTVDSYTFNDNLGNGNGIIEAGETIDLAATLKAFNFNAQNVTVNLTTPNSYITILNSTANFGNIPSGGTGSNLSNPFRFRVNADFSQGPINLNLKISADGYYVERGIALKVLNYKFYNAGIALKDTSVVSDIDADGILDIFLKNNSNSITCLNPDKTTKWSRHEPVLTSSTAHCIADLDGDGELEVIIAGYTQSGTILIQAIDKTGQVKRELTFNNGMKPLDFILPVDLNNDGNLEILAHESFGYIPRKLYCISNLGQIIWQKNDIDGWPAAADIDKDGYKEVLAGGKDGKMYCFGHDGQPKWSYNTYLTYGLEKKGPSISDINGDGFPEILFGCSYNSHKLYCLDHLGNRLWYKNLSWRIENQIVPSIADLDPRPGLEVLIAAAGALYCYDKDGKELWHFTSGSSVIRSNAAIANLDHDGPSEIIFGSNDYNVYCLNNLGQKLWSFKTDATVESSPSIADLDNDGYLEVLIGANDGYLYVFDRNGQPFSYNQAGNNYVMMPWPLFQHDPQHSGRYNRPPVLDSIGNKQVYHGSPLTFTIAGSDPDGDQVQFTAIELPPGATFSNNLFSWTPSYSQKGSYNVTFRISDGELSDEEVIIISILKKEKGKYIDEY